MRVLRKAGFVSFLLVITIAISAYGPWDFLGLMDRIDCADAYISDGASAEITGLVYHKEIKNDKPVFYIKNATIRVDSILLKDTSIILYLDSDTIPNYSTITCMAKLELFSCARNQGNYDEKEYYNSMGLVCKATATEEVRVIGGLFINDYLYKIRCRVADFYVESLRAEEAGFLASITLGDKSNLKGELKELFQEAGVAHVLAVSGLHISFLCMGLYRLLRKRGLSFLGCSLFSGSFAIMYGIMTGASVSSVRAVGMFLIYLLSQILGENYDMTTSLAIMADIVLIRNPLYIKNPSFIFSFGAVLGVIYVAIPLSKQLNSENKIKNSFIFSVGITVATLPILTLMNYQIPTYSILLNMLVLPLMPFLLGLGLMGGFVGLFLPVIGRMILLLCHYIIFVFEMVSHFFVRLPVSTIVVGRPSVAKIVFFLATVLIIVNVRRPSIWKKVLGLLVISVLFVSLKSHNFEIDFLDVGQGDGIYISCDNKTDIFIDGGSTTVKEVGKYRILPFLKYKGVASVEYWFVSHGDEDHVSGLIELLSDDYKVKNIVVSKYVVETDSLKELISLAGEKGVSIIYMEKGQSLRCGNVTLQNVFPDELYSTDPNTQSLALVLDYDRDGDNSPDFSCFFGGDLPTESEQRVDVKKVDLLKLSHHGSRFSSDEEFLHRLRPTVAIISCGEGNSYGHPHKETIERLKKSSIEVYRTDMMGQITVTFKQNNYTLDTKW